MEGLYWKDLYGKSHCRAPTLALIRTSQLGTVQVKEKFCLAASTVV